MTSKSIDLRKILTDVATAVFDLHTNELAHLDIKPCNIVYVGTEQTYKIIDFGSFRRLNSDGTVCIGALRSPNPLIGALRSPNPLIGALRSPNPLIGALRSPNPLICVFTLHNIALH